MTRPRVGVAVLTMGNRPAELLALLDSVARQDESAARVVVVGNGAGSLAVLPAGVEGMELEQNRGVSGGRNVAWDRLRECGDVDVLVDLDDDGLLVDTDVIRQIADLYEADPGLGIGSFARSRGT